MMENLVGDLFVKPNQHFCLVVAEFNEFITSRLADSAVECLLRHGAKETQITRVKVPGSFEIPTVASQAAKSGKFSAVICLGAVIRGQTSHYEHVTDQVSRGVGAIGRDVVVARDRHVEWFGFAVHATGSMPNDAGRRVVTGRASIHRSRARIRCSPGNYSGVVPLRVGLELCA